MLSSVEIETSARLHLVFYVTSRKIPKYLSHCLHFDKSASTVILAFLNRLYSLKCSRRLLSSFPVRRYLTSQYPMFSDNFSE